MRERPPAIGHQKGRGSCGSRGFFRRKKAVIEIDIENLFQYILASPAFRCGKCRVDVQRERKPFFCTAFSAMQAGITKLDFKSIFAKKYLTWDAACART